MARSDGSSPGERTRRDHDVALGACFVALEIVVDGTVGLAAGRVRRILVRRPRAARGVEVASGTVFRGLGAKLAVTR